MTYPSPSLCHSVPPCLSLPNSSSSVCAPLSSSMNRPGSRTGVLTLYHVVTFGSRWSGLPRDSRGTRCSCKLQRHRHRGQRCSPTILCELFDPSSKVHPALLILRRLPPGWTELPWGGWGCPGMDPAAPGWTELPQGGQSCPRVDGTAPGWMELPRGGPSCPRVDGAAPRVDSAAPGWTELPWGGWGCPGVDAAAPGMDPAAPGWTELPQGGRSCPRVDRAALGYTEQPLGEAQAQVETR